MATYTPTLEKSIDFASFAEQIRICNEMLADGEILLDALKAAVVIGEVAVEKHGHPKAIKMNVGKSFAERWTFNLDHYREYFNVFDVVIR